MSRAHLEKRAISWLGRLPIMAKPREAVLHECRFCLQKVQSKHCVDIFTPSSVRNNLPGILSSIFDLPVSQSTQISSYVCQTCRNRSNSLHNKLLAMRSMGHKSYQIALGSSAVIKHGQKRPKDTSSGLDISPDTQKSQPPRKVRAGMGKRLIFCGKITQFTRIMY